MKKLYIFITISLFVINIDMGVLAQNGTKITETTLVEIKVNSILHVSCQGDKKGAIDIIVSGGIPPYRYEWSNGETTQDIAGLAAGKYMVKVTDSHDCPDSLEIEIKEPEKLTLKVDSIADILCYGYNKGSIEVSITGGVRPYTYSWSNQTTSEDLINAPAGEYALLVTDANHCQEILSATIKQNPLIVRSDEKVQNIQCAGDNTGTIDVKVEGGIPPYKYKWTTGETTEDLDSLYAGMYTIQVIDSRGCIEAYSTKVIEPDPIIIDLESARDIYCAGDKSGAIDIKVKGGMKPYTFSWNDSLATTEDLAGLSAGKYTLIVKDARNCHKELIQEIKEPSKVEVRISQVKNVVNFGESNGAIYLDVTGGVPPYKYKWSNGPKTKDIANIPANNYTCRITDANNCVNNISVNIEQPTTLEAKISKIEHIKCYGQSDGFIDISVNGGVTPYSFAWSNGKTTEDISNLAAGTYSVTITDAHNMKRELKCVIEQPSVLKTSLQSVSHNLCFGDKLGSADINVSGGTQPYSYSWSNGAKTQDIANVSAGKYSVKIIDKNQCLDTLDVEILQNPKLEVVSSEVIDIKCFGRAEGMASIAVTGGSEPYKYSWSNGATTPNLTNIKAGKYNLKVTDGKGCEGSLEVQIKEPSKLQSEVTSVTDVKCKGDATGIININVKGGSVPYTYQWNNESETKDNVRITAGNYTVKITDAKGCTNTLSATVKEPTKLISTIDKTTDIDCFDDATGVIEVSVNGGIPPYMYKWSNGATTQNLVGIKAGDYNLTINDQNGCLSKLEASIKENSLLKATIKEVIDIKCFGLSTGTADVEITGGVEPYTYKWSNGEKAQNLKGVTAGNYSLIVTDAKSCVTQTSLTISEPEKFEGMITEVSKIKCNGDANAAIKTSFSGGVTPYNFVWNNKMTTKDINGLKAGEYTLLATDKNGCKDTVSTLIEEPTSLDLKLISSINNLCYGESNGAIDIFVKGSVTPYTYKWSNGEEIQDLKNLKAGSYKVIVTGATGCQDSLTADITEPEPLELLIASTEDVNCFDGDNGKIGLEVKGGVLPYKFSWSNGATTQSLTNLVAGSYTVNVEDKQGCSKSISAHIKQPMPLNASLDNIKNIACNGDSTGAISISVKGGTLPYSFKWSNGATAEDISKLPVGNYSVSITDSKGCAQNLSATITQPEALVAKLVSVQDVLCKNHKTGAIDISVKGGVTPYVYSWNNGSKDQDLINIGANRYSVKIQDANECIKTLDTKITEPTELLVALDQVTNIMEYGRSDGQISINVNGGNPPYTYSWSNGEATQNIKGLVAGNYSVIVKDENECRKDLSTEIIQPEEIIVSVDSTRNIYCYGEKTGYVKTSVTGGIAPYKYSWNNGVVSNELKNVPAGEYILTVTDANNAKKIQKVILNEPLYFDLEISSFSHPTCYELNNGLIKTTVSGGTSPYNFEWNTGSSSEDLKGLTSGNYKVVVTDARGCKLSDSIELKKPNPLEVMLLDTIHNTCNGAIVGGIRVGVKGGTAPYQYSWSNGAKKKDLTNVLAGHYSLKVIDANQCVKTINATIKEPPAMLASFASIKNVPCKGESKGAIATTVTGGTPPYKYEWNTGDSAASVNGLIAGKYNVIITDQNDCIEMLATEITEPPTLTGKILNVRDIKCFGTKEGAINIDVQGGTLPYRFNWSNGSKEQNLNMIGAGKYSIKVTDNQGCEIALETTIQEPPKLLASIANKQDIKCFGDVVGSIDVSVSGGVEPYKYSWSNGATTQDLLKIAAGNYTLKVFDANGCSNIISTKVEEPLPLTVETLSVTNNQCSGENKGSITVAVKGGRQPYSYSWSNKAGTKDLQNLVAGNYTLTVTDGNGCSETTSADVTEPPGLNNTIDAINHITCNGESNGAIQISVSGGVAPYSYQWSNGNTIQDLLDVPAGDYSVIIKEGNGCETTLEASITEPVLFVSKLIDVVHNKCYNDENGSIRISADGGTPPYSFKWNNGATTQDLTDIVSGDYSVLVSDANGCNRTIKTTVREPEKLKLTVDSARNVKCCGDTSGAIFITVTGGVGPYTYQWSNGATTEDITGLPEGQYTVSITDQNNCVVATPEEGATIYEKIISSGKFVSRDILFDVGKSTIKEQSFVEISRIASFMKEHPDLKFSIEGHTDSQGDETANMKLSKERSNSVREALIKFGIDGTRLKTQGWGESMPIDTNATKEGRANNRRVEFIPF